MDSIAFIKNLGFSDNEARIFEVLYPMGAQPASVIAKNVGLERTTTYYLLMNLNKEGVLGITKRAGTQCFFVREDDILEKLIRERLEKLKNLQECYPQIKYQLEKKKETSHIVPKIQIYDGFEQVQNMFSEIIGIIDKEEVREIRCIASNTFQQQLGNSDLEHIAQSFIKRLEKLHVRVRLLLSEGTITRERIHPLEGIEHLLSLPTSTEATNIYILGKYTFIVSFRDIPIGIQIDHIDVAQTMHFLFNMLNIQNSKI